LRLPDRGLDAEASAERGSSQEGGEGCRSRDLLPRTARTDRGHRQDEKAPPSRWLNCAGREVSGAGRDRGRRREGGAAFLSELLLVACLSGSCSHEDQTSSRATRGVCPLRGRPAAPSVSVRIPSPSRVDFAPVSPLEPESRLRPVVLSPLGATMSESWSTPENESTTALGRRSPLCPLGASRHPTLTTPATLASRSCSTSAPWRPHRRRPKDADGAK
jgi:hypothetical protein